MPAISIIQKQGFHVRYRPGTADEEVLNESFEHDLFFPGVPEYRLQPDHIIADIGAHIGCFSLLAASQLTTGKVYSFEPSAETYQLLEKNVQTNNLPNIKTFQLAVAAKAGTTRLYHDKVLGNWGHTITKEVSAESEIVNCITLGDFIELENLEHIDFIKFNCEGAEFGILLNTAPALLRRVKCMLILYHGYLEETFSEKQLAGYLSAAGFKLHRRYRNREDDSGWLIAYQAGFAENISINLRTLPLATSLFIKELKRKIKRTRQILFEKNNK
ncbi:MAG: FkbM family methyltransferase [Bacteroidota bacterium]|nr:FkbM family methyltransferase [Bacteroidota bacterium]